MKHENLKFRTKQLAIRVFRMSAELPHTNESLVIRNQLIRSASSIAANYRAGCLAKSPRDFVNKLKIVEEEADETVFWLEMIQELGYFHVEKINPLLCEANEIFLIIAASIRTARRKAERSTSPDPLKQTPNNNP